MSRAPLAVLTLAALAAGCGPAPVRPVAYPDTDVPCPGGRMSWDLQVLDRRADRESTERAVGAVRDAIQKSFPGCRWTQSETPGEAAITIQIHRLASVKLQGAWEAAAEWTVSVRDGAGRTLTEFEANEDVLRPDYRGSDNEKESISEAFRKAVERTVKGLSAIPTSGAARPPEGTPAARALSRTLLLGNGLTPWRFESSAPGTRLRARAARVERISHNTPLEDL